MKRGSIRLRLLLAAAVSILVALTIAAFGLVYLFERHVERRLEAEMTVDLNQLIASVGLAADGTPQTASLLSDPRFETPLSGYYWQVQDPKSGKMLRSRSLWDALLYLPTDSIGGLQQSHEVAGPDGVMLVAVERTIEVRGGHALRVAVAESHQTVEASVREYLSELAPAVVFLALILFAANFIQIGIGVAPLEKLRIAVREVVSKKSNRLSMKAPSEVQPLADEINRMLAAQEKAIDRERTRAADLAHGLKTPLQVLSGDIRSLRAKGENELATEIEKSVSSTR